VSVDTTQWLRFFQVIVGKAGKGLDVRASHADGLRVVFTVEKTLLSKPNVGDVTIYNLHPFDERLVLEEFEDLILNVGYLKRYPKPGEAAEDLGLYETRVVFSGNIKHAVSYWDTPDRKVDIQAADGDRDYRHAVVNTVLAAGTSNADEVKAALRAMASTRAGHVNVKSKKALRGKVVLGPARDVLGRIAADSDAHWSIQDGALQIVPSTGVTPDEAVVVNSETGLIGAPELSDQGIRVTSLLNPLIAPNGRVLLNNANIKIQTNQLMASGPKQKARHLVRMSPDGVYKVFKVRHEGDSRGDAKTIFECIALGDAIPVSGKPVVRI
jgi:hypothetical protein